VRDERGCIRRELRIEVRMSMFSILVSAILLLNASCTNNVEQQQDGYTCTVVNKEIKSNKYILEISSSDRHEYTEISEKHWHDINIGDSVTFDGMGVLVKVNNTPLDP